MREDLWVWLTGGRRLSACLRRAALAVVACGVVTAHADPANETVLVLPAQLPELARQTGEAMFLYDRFDGKTLLYIEQNQGARLAALDVTDPVHIKGAGLVEFEASGPFDFIAPLGNAAERVRFRLSHEEAVLELPRMSDPQLKTVPGFTADQPIAGSVSAYQLDRVFDTKQVRAQLTKGDTGTTFVLTDEGLYGIRRPVTESIHQMMMIPPN
jgi:hypothetical protein